MSSSLHLVKPNADRCTLLSAEDLYLFNEGSHLRLYEKLGAHPIVHRGVAGTYFAVWAPDAEYVSVVGDFNHWNAASHPLTPRDRSGIWEGFFPQIGPGALYKYHVTSRYRWTSQEKADPFGAAHEVPPRTASIVATHDYEWNDDSWMHVRARHNALSAPISIYEMHVGSWMRLPEEGNRWLTYREIAPRLIAHLLACGFTHVEFLPVMEHPFYGSWGYQTTGYFAPTARYGTPQDFMYLIDQLHQAGIGVILDWVPSHFPNDAHGLADFDGTHLFEHADPRKGFHPDWASCIFNYGRNEVRSFLLSSALMWLDRFHADGLRVDAVASMLYLDYSRNAGEWIPNQFGGRENLEAIAFLQRLNAEAYRAHPDILMFAEESTAWPMVSRPTSMGGLGFGLKWDMGWMNDTLRYFSKDAIHRQYHQQELTFRQLYAHTENFLLPLSHDEVVHGKGALLAKMPGDDWQKFANLRLLLGYQFAQPGKKLLFMGSEFGQWNEWHHEVSLDWHLCQYDRHQGIQRWVTDLNRCYRTETAFHQRDCEPDGFAWIDCQDTTSSVLSFLRRDHAGHAIVVVCNFTPVPRAGYHVGVPHGGYWRELLNSDAQCYGGSDMGNSGGAQALAEGCHGQPYALSLTLPPLAILVLKGMA